jgi:hypothetical protein
MQISQKNLAPLKSFRPDTKIGAFSHNARNRTEKIKYILAGQVYHKNFVKFRLIKGVIPIFVFWPPGGQKRN